MPTVINGSTGIDKVQDDAVNPVTDIASGIPCFSAYRATSSQAISSGIWTKIQFNAIEFDTTNAYDEITNFRFQPTVAGYYKVAASIVTAIVPTVLGVAIYKNGGTTIKQNVIATNMTSSSSSINVNAIIYLDGVSDYIEGMAFVTGTSPVLAASQDRTYFQAHLIAGA